MPRFAEGVVKFQNEVYPNNKEMFARLAEGQTPEALFVTCSDSRVETAMITQSAPGDLFICRNAGNIIPPHTEYTGGMTASIEFAVAALGVPHIVVCGHTDCGAMQGALHPERIKGMPHVNKWLGYTSAAVQVVNELGADKSDEERMLLLLEQNVMLQLTHLKTHPSVAARLARGNLQLHGWVYDIKTGEVNAYNALTNCFEPIETYYTESLARHAKSCDHKPKK